MNLAFLRSCDLCVDVYVWLYVHVTGLQKANRRDGMKKEHEEVSQKLEEKVRAALLRFVCVTYPLCSYLR